MGVVIGLVNAIGLANGAALALGRWLGALAMALMVLAILVQVFFRYVLNSALPWPEEAARFLMLWATGLMAPTALRRGGFVSIDMIVRLLPRMVATVLAAVLLLCAILLLSVGLTIAWSEVTGIGGRFETDSLWVPVSLDLSVWMKAPKAWMMASMLVGVFLLLTVSVELFLRNLVVMLGAGDALRDIPETISLGVE
ncbi:MAG: TRAP transporter small permease subunit [Cypionkella sp.]|jgi:TRAP-type C4-dicarboxylate transport system permease small subunit|nr:TRAP transporter small permease subunit [Cypionkella sp.]